jgi:hypothetical protein
LRKRSGVALSAVLGFSLAASLGAPAEGGVPTEDFEITAARRAGAPYDEDGFRLNLDEDENKSVLLKVKSTNGQPEDVTLRQSPIWPEGITAKHFRDDLEITDAVLGEGYNVTVQSGPAERFRARFKRPNGTSGEGCANIHVSQLDGSFSAVLIAINQDKDACVI